MATSLSELLALRQLVRELAERLDAHIAIERGEQERADRLGEPLPRTRIR